MLNQPYIEFLPTVTANICLYRKSLKYLTADCSAKGLTEVPILKSNIEVLDLSSNKIYKLHNNSFNCCTSIQLLYLDRNLIVEVASHTFHYLSNLQVLDLSTNVLEEIPKNLPSSLHRLYIDYNMRIFERNSTSLVLKISSLKSLEVLTASFNNLRIFPRFDGLVPSLIELNITANDIKLITPVDLAPLCQLRLLYVSGNKLFTEKTDQCTCRRFLKWVKDYKILVDAPITCIEEKSCVMEQHKNETLLIREKCLEDLNARKLPYNLMIGSGIIAVIFGGTCILLYIRYYTRKSERSKTAGCQTSRAPRVKYGSRAVKEKLMGTAN